MVSNIRPEAQSRPTARFGKSVCGRFNKWEHFQTRLLHNNFICNSFADPAKVTVLGEHAQQHSPVADRHTHRSVFVPAHITTRSNRVCTKAPNDSMSHYVFVTLFTLSTNKDVNKETLFQFDVEEL